MGLSTAAPPRNVNELTQQVIGAAIAVHRELGPGLLESAYDACLTWEMRDRGIVLERQKPLNVYYRGMQVDAGYRLDYLIDGRLIVEIKAIERFDPIHTAQMLTYLKLSGCRLGLLINFNVTLLKDGIRRVALNLPEPPAPSPSALRPPRPLR